MKKLFFIAIALLIAGTSTFAQEKSAKQIAKERKELMKYSRKALEEKASKDARKEAKRLTKQGWRPIAGSLPLEKQLDIAYKMQFEYDEDLYPRYIMGEATAVSTIESAARLQADQLAKEDLASNIQTEITGLIENTATTQQIAPDDATAMVKTVAASKSLISQTLTTPRPVLQMSRVLPNKNYEVTLRFAYSGAQAKQNVKNVMLRALEGEGSELHDRISNQTLWNAE
ncbi:MAG: hypothetical protein NC206_08520 [Bacteroides sp.]|nr:hypothetical protein [Roseburia sp.]MCM1347113.1 hypothetical protein [Bacteroides sp.]MCM1421665.1 hypothetical protein [Bacteroides sp.]